ncbi:Sedoheptulose 1,7-bisphosphatase [Collariella sp. IMI 366227]|nr:Sedoheptulose 1,7-bisphosphatase [Collariella sp. IMI 366227]
MSTPRVFIIRHGETEWSLDGRHTGSTDIPLTANGEKRVLATGKALKHTQIQVTEDIREWDYGDYEGITTPHIRQLRKEQGLDSNWDIWRDGCPGGESPTDISGRLDQLIEDIRERWHAPVMGKSAREGCTGDVLIVAHGHILRAFAQRWAGKSLVDGPTFLLEAGGVGTLSYEHHNIDEPAILLGGAFIVDIPGM